MTIRFKCPIMGHEENIEKYFKGNILGGIGDTVEPIENAVFMCFTNRCGSNYFAELLKSTSILLGFGEPFNHDVVTKLSTEKNYSSMAEYVCGEYKTHMYPHKIWGAKMAWMQLAMFYRWELMQKLFVNPRFLFITRRDKIAQAVSYMVASQTQKWLQPKGKAIKKDAIKYNAKVIHEHIQATLMAERWLEELFIINNIRSIRVVYEELLDQPNRIISGIYEQLGFGPVTPELDLMNIDQQRTIQNQYFRLRFLEEQVSY